MADQQKFIDRMLEAENLTDYLEDDDADYLTNWGIAQLKEIIGKIEDIPTAGEYTNYLMGFLRTLNQITGNLDNIQQDDLVQLVERRQKAFGPWRDLTPGDYIEATSRLEAMTPRQAIDYLLRWLLPEKSLSSEDGSPSKENLSSKEDSSPKQTYVSRKK
jgi:hypothetical protein